eukprot:43572-Eustigmatos_ZCMA.PRE.1
MAASVKKSGKHDSTADDITTPGATPPPPDEDITAHPTHARNAHEEHAHGRHHIVHSSLTTD